jgi:hypothetical protein
MKNLKEMTESKYFKTVLGLLGCLIAAVIVFAAGVRVGEHRARYSYQWGANYEKNFMGGPREMMGNFRGEGGFRPDPRVMMRDLGGRDFRNGHGISGTITSITDNNIVIKDQDGKENTVTVSEKTLIKNGPADIKITDLKNEQRIVVLGSPAENGVINANLIRVFDNNFNPQK